MKGLILLDRDGVLNDMVVCPEHGLIDSPLHPDQVIVPPEVPLALKSLNDMGYRLAIVTNQPAWAKGKTTKKNLDDVHEKIVSRAQIAGAVIADSHICFHRAEESCACRKPRTKLLQEAIDLAGLTAGQPVWMVGDGVTDVEAGKKLGLKTAFLGPKKCYFCKCFEKMAVMPEFWGESLGEFVDFLWSS